MKYLVVASVIGLSFPSAAQEEALGWPDFKSGNFEGAIEKVQNDDTADGHTLACRSHLVIGGFQTEGEQAVQSLHNAIDECQKAIEQDPNHVIARMSYAMALGIEGKRLTSPGLATRSKKQIEALVELYPDDPLVHGALGGWHSEVAAAGFLARVALGAKRSRARELFGKSLEQGSLDIPLRFEYVKFLARGNKKERAQALEEIDALGELTPGFVFEEMVQAFARKLRPVVAAGKKSNIKKKIAELSAFYGIEKWGSDLPAYTFPKK